MRSLVLPLLTAGVVLAALGAGAAAQTEPAPAPAAAPPPPASPSPAASPSPDPEAVRDTIRAAIGGAMAPRPDPQAAEGGPPAADAPAMPQGGAAVPSVQIEDQRDPSYLIGKELRCPVCQGMPIADSPSDMAQDMMRRVRELRGEGKSKDEILDYFVKAYGEWVLLRPRPRGENWLVWLLPPLALIFGIIAIRATIRQNQSRQKAGGKAPEPQAGQGGDEDPYIRLVREEVRR